MPRVFISYRIADTRDLVERLEKSLTDTFGANAVFLDKQGLEPGDVWTDKLETEAQNCTVMLVVIGPQWRSVTVPSGDLQGLPRLQDPGDWVRREVIIGLTKAKRVVPILVHDAVMPPARWLKACAPELEPLASQQGLPLSDQQHFQIGLASIVEMLKSRGFAPLHETEGAATSSSEQSLPTELTLETRIENFREEYLHRDDHAAPVPFGGRDTELAELDTWLTNETGPARCLVSAVAGRGKSALLIAWLQRLQEHGHCIAPNQAGLDSERWHVVFVPISIRFGTNVPESYHRAIAERLARIAKQHLRPPATDPAGYYGDRVSELLRELGEAGTRVLLVIDGLDEALRGEFSPELIPKRLPWNVRVLTSARWRLGDDDSKGWLQHLEWDASGMCHSLELRKLDASAIADVLAKMGAPVDHLAAERQVVERLEELTEGEPLLLRYYAEDLWGLAKEREAPARARIGRADLDALKPGFGAYFERWLDLQQQAWKAEGQSVDPDVVDALLSILAFAHGPLESTDLAALLARSPILATTTPLVGRLLTPLRRFVIGSGQPGSGHVLAHPKIGAYLKEQRYREVCEPMRKAFVAWGREVVFEVNGHPVGKHRVSAYVLQYHRQHLTEIDAPLEDFMALVQDGWRRAWERYEGSAQGFSADVHAAWVRARSGGPLAELGAQLRCVVVLSSVRSRGVNMPGPLLVAAVKSGVLTARQAIHFLEFIPSKGEVSACLKELALGHRPNSEHRLHLMREALAAASAIGDLDNRVSALSGLAPHLPAEFLGEALAAASAIGEDRHRASALSGLAPHLPAEQRSEALKQALAAASAIGDEYQRASALSGLAPHLPAELLGEALAAASAIGNEYQRASALSGLVAGLPCDLRSPAMLEMVSLSHLLARSDLLQCLEPFYETIAQVGGPPALIALRDTICETAQWYP